jgi:hypothetical protein
VSRCQEAKSGKQRYDDNDPTERNAGSAKAECIPDEKVSHATGHENEGTDPRESERLRKKFIYPVMCEKWHLLYRREDIAVRIAAFYSVAGALVKGERELDD